MKQFNKMLTNKAQSILELAIFGSIILFLLGVLIQYGISFNYQQHLAMQTFRKALQISRNRSMGSPQVSLTAVKDLPVPDPSNPLGVVETSPVTAGASGIWSIDLYAESLGDENAPPEDKSLPKTDIIINAIQKTYKTAKFGYYTCSSTEEKATMINKKETNYGKLPLTWDQKVGPCWYWKMVEDTDVKVGDAVDIDNDGKTETIVKIKEVEVPFSGKVLVGFWYLDLQEGDIDITIQPETGIPQGLQPKETKDVETNASIVKTENAAGINSTRHATVDEIIKRTIKTRQGDETVTSDIHQEQSSDWQTDW